MKQLTLLTTLLTVLCLAFAPLALAQAPETTDSADLRRAIRERIEQTLQNADETESPYIGYIGNVEQIGTATFTLTSPRGEHRTIQVGSAARLLSGNETIALGDLVVGNGVSIIGQEMDDLVIDAIRIIANDAPYDETRQVTIGTVTNVATTSLTVTVRGTGTSESFILNRTTTYEDIQGTEVLLRNIEEDQAVLLVTDVNAQNQRFAKRVRLLIPVEEN